MKLQAAYFWVLTPRSNVVGYNRFGELYHLHLQG